MKVPSLSTLRILTVLVAIGAGLAAYAALRAPSTTAVHRLGAELTTNGRDGVVACASCHGAQGEGNFAAGFPRLAGLDAAYIAKQLRDFAREAPLTGAQFEAVARDYSKTPRINLPYSILTPGIRKDPVMGPIAMALKPEEIEALAQYFASLAFTAKPVPAAPEILERGEDLVLRGKPEYGVPGCFSCHGQNGVGVGAVFPPLAGQPPEYIIEQINRWQSGARDNDENALMRSIAVWMTDGDKHYLATYLANLSYATKPR